MAEITIGFIPIARPTFDVEFAQDMADRACVALEEAGFKIIKTDGLIMSLEAAEAIAAAMQADSPDLLLVFQASFADSTMISRLADWVDCPLLIWAVPEERTGGRLRLNSLCGLNLAAHALTRQGYTYDYVYALPENPEALEKIKIVAQAASVVKKLQETRMGRLGENPDGFETCIPNDDLLQNHLGVKIVRYELAPFFQRVREHQQSPGSFVEVALQLDSQLENFAELEQVPTTGTLATFVSLRELAARDDLSGIAVRCWPEFFTEMGCAACGAMSLMNQENIPCGCESDVNGTLTHLMLQWIAGEPAFNSDLVDFNLEDNTAVLWHCGQAPLSMADTASPARGTIHSNRKLPLLMEFALKPGRVTLARLSEATGELRLVIGAGEILAASPSFSGTSGVIRFDRPVKEVLDTLIQEGLEHHIALAYGNHVPVLESLARQLQLPILYL
ncbi:MAG: L-fucose/L-arabinose isomerase family protein [Anaerolineae bacterium]|nr:L-fucose/L-arabinose isomerase family protein [Anaerolineae bacterium]